MTLIAAVVFAVLSGIALLHAAWAFGVHWPAHDEQSLINRVIGKRGMTEMPGIGLTLLVVIGIASGGVCALWGARLVSLPLPEWLSSLSIVVLAIIFGLRGVASYLPGPLSSSVEPFATLDRHYYAPLCLALCCGYLFIYHGR
ncbi:MAG: DUF3995 domain-containing protein [Granulosicoccus sp.]